MCIYLIRTRVPYWYAIHWHAYTIPVYIRIGVCSRYRELCRVHFLDYANEIKRTRRTLHVVVIPRHSFSPIETVSSLKQDQFRRQAALQNVLYEIKPNTSSGISSSSISNNSSSSTVINYHS